MSRNEKRKMSFTPIVKHSDQDEDEDLLNQEIDEMFQSSSDFRVRKISENVDLTSERNSSDDEDELYSKVVQTLNGDQVKNANKFLQVEGARRARMSEIIDSLSEDDHDGKQSLDGSKGITKPPTSLYSGSTISFNIIDEFGSKVDHRPHDLFIQLNELHGEKGFEEWRETARWIKYEENVQEGADRFGRPHLSSLSFHSLINVRRCLESGVVMMDADEKDFAHIVHRAVETMFSEGVIRIDDRDKVFETFMIHHSYDRNTLNFGINKKRSLSIQSLRSESDKKNYSSSPRKSVGNIRKYNRRGSTAVFHPIRTSNFLSPMFEVIEDDEENDESKSMEAKVAIESEPETQQEQIVQNEYLLKRLPVNCEGAVVLIGQADFLEQPTIAFIRLVDAVKIPNVLEVSVPVRFIFMLLGPKSEDLDYHEVGRSIATLMSNKQFTANAYKAKVRKDLMVAINEFLNESLVLPPGKIDKEALLSFDELKEKSDQIRMRKRRAILKSHDKLLSEDQLKFLADKFEAGQKTPVGPLQKTGRLWGGLINDLKRRFPMFKSDITDGFNTETFAATVFLYFACFASAITFGGLTNDFTKGYIGIPETLLSASFVGMVFHTFCGQPLVIIATTGPLILFDKALIKFCLGSGFDFLNVRVYIGFWLVIISLIVSAVEGSVYVRLFTRFTQEIFSALITLIYLYSTLSKTIKIFKRNPLMNVDDYSKLNQTSTVASYKVVNQPNTALFCACLTIGTFVLAYGLKIFRNSHFLGRTSRRALGDFGVPISITIFVIISNMLSQVETEKLNVPEGINPTFDRDWLVPLWKDDNPIWLPLASFIPAFLVYILLFLESHISELILDKPERKLKKGSGFHWDIVLLCFLNCVCGLFGMPWHCSATVKSVAHISAVTVMSTNHPPGESPRIVSVKEQRLSGFFVSLLIGLSMFAAPILKKIPTSVLFGVFLYMGVSSIHGVHLFERMVLFFVPVKYHPHVPYATKVLTKRMHFYTAVQVVALSVLWIVNQSPISLAFPFFLLMMVPLRKLLDHFYSPSELEALDGATHADDDDIEDKDFYEQTHLPA